jgi:DNA-binding transcriptional LysR family regulator
VLPGYGRDVVTLPIEEALERTVAIAWQNWETLPLAARSFTDFIRREAPRLLDGIPGVQPGI